MNSIIIIIIIILLIFIMINNLLRHNLCKYEIIFLKKEELLNMLIDNKDNYYNRFYNHDFSARNIKNINEYKELISHSVSEFNQYQKKKLKRSIQQADLFLSKLNLEWFKSENNQKIEWILGCIKGKLYENGLPHTRNNTIIISSEKVNEYDINRLTKTLIHERVHIYQKIFKEDMNIFLVKNQFRIYKERSKDDNIRANPDLDNLIYIDNKNNIYRGVYNEDPQSIEDILYSPYDEQSYEHPFEKMAIDIENIYKNE